MKTLKVLLTTLVLLLVSGSAYADCMGPNPEPGTRPEWAGTQCMAEDLLGTNCNGQCGGQCGEGEQHKYGQQDEFELLGGQCGDNCGDGEQHQYGRQ